MANFSDNLAVSFVDHQVDLFRYEAQQRKDVLAFLLLMANEIRTAIETADLGGTLLVNQARMEELLKEIEAILKNYYRQARNYNVSELRELMAAEATWAANAMNSAVGVNLFEVTFTKQSLASLVSDVMIEGAPSKEWWNRQATQVLNQFKDQIRMGLALGETNDQLINRVIGGRTGFTTVELADGTKKRLGVYEGGVMSASRRNAEALVRSSVQAVANDSKFKMYEENADLLYGYQQLSVLDTKTSDICIARSGKAWKLDGTPIGDHKKRFRIPPLHWNCRSILLPILKSWQALSKDGKPVLSLPGSMQASMDGQIGADIDYAAWLKGRSDKEVIDVLGRGRFELWKQGKLKVSDLTDQNDRPLTLQQLRERV